ATQRHHLLFPPRRSSDLMSVASAVGFIALGGVAAEFGVIMLLYLKQALEKHGDEGEPYTSQVVTCAIVEGAVLRVRPKAMTLAVDRKSTRLNSSHVKISY